MSFDASGIRSTLKCDCKPDCPTRLLTVGAGAFGDGTEELGSPNEAEKIGEQSPLSPSN